MGKVIILNHPLISHKMSVIRDKNTSVKEFREGVSEVGGLITYEVTKDLELKEKTIETPICTTKVFELKDEIVIIPILRAGLGMVDGIHKLIPFAKIGHIGMFRDENTLEPKVYYAKFPQEIKDGICLLVDPMLATGNSAVKAIEILKSHGAKTIKYVGLVGCDEGINNILSSHSDVDIYLASKDSKLNENGYIVPGLGDCGDRLFGTK
jgi:uracil phosphoribosyltransferase